MDNIEIDGRIQALVNQRDNANNEVVTLVGKIAVMQATIQTLEQKVKDLTPVKEEENA